MSEHDMLWLALLGLSIATSMTVLYVLMHCKIC